MTNHPTSAKPLSLFFTIPNFDDDSGNDVNKIDDVVNIDNDVNDKTIRNAN